MGKDRERGGEQNRPSHGTTPNTPNQGKGVHMATLVIYRPPCGCCIPKG